MTASELVFITGSTGFIGSHVANHTIEAGYRIRLSIRRPEQEQSVRKWLRGPQEKVEFVHIPDMTRPEAFKDALKGVDHIFHIASPMPGKGEDVKRDYVDPAVNGTLAVLKEAKQHKSIKFVIVVSSIMAVLPLGGIRNPPMVPKANSREHFEVDLNREFPDGFPGYGLKYQASKLLAQQATKDFVAREKPAYKLITFHPGFVIGDSLIQHSSADIDGMNARFWLSLESEEPVLQSAFVHVRDVAQAHVAALQRHESLKAGTEYIVCQQPFVWDKVAELVRKEFPQVAVKLKQGPFAADDWHFDTLLAEQDLQIKWRTGEEMVRDVMKQQLAFKEDENADR